MPQALRQPVARFVALGEGELRAQRGGLQADCFLEQRIGGFVVLVPHRHDGLVIERLGHDRLLALRASVAGSGDQEGHRQSMEQEPNAPRSCVAWRAG